MPIETAAHLVELLHSFHLLTPDQARQLDGAAKLPSDPKALARALVQRDWLTPYQVNQIFGGRVKELVLGSYVLMDKVGEGGMGAVFRARNWKLGRTVALKLIRKEQLENKTAIERFQREIRAAGQLNHRNIVRAYDADAVGDANFFVMEYVPGTDLAKMVKTTGPLPVAAACEYIRQAALGLQHAAENGMVHRDIKPANILVAEAPAEGSGIVVKILDMGLVRRKAVEGNESATITHAGSVMGTPDYLSPEQSMESHKVDIRSDLYSLGCTFYFLLTGNVPFPGGSLVEKLLKHQLHEPERVEKLRPDCPSAVATILRKLMAKRPEDRYQTPVEAALALDAFLAGSPLPQEEAPAHDMANAFAFLSAGDPPTDPQMNIATDPDLASMDATLPSMRRMRHEEERQKQLWRIFLWSGGIGAGVLLLVVLVLIFALR